MRELKRSRRVNEDTNYKAHQDWAIRDVKKDLDMLLRLHESLNPGQFNEKRIRDSIERIEALLAYLYNAYRIELKINSEGSDVINKKLFREAEDEVHRAALEAEGLLDLLNNFDHNFYLDS